MDWVRWCEVNGYHHLVEKTLRKRKAFNNWKPPEERENHVNDKRWYYRNVYLKSDHWKELRARKLRSNPNCAVCGCLARDVHHVEYANLYDVKTYQLRSVCRPCHDRIHQLERDELLIFRFGETVEGKWAITLRLLRGDQRCLRRQRGKSVGLRRRFEKLNKYDLIEQNPHAFKALCELINGKAKDLMKSNLYTGTFTQQDWYQVTLNGQPFDPTPSLKLRNHSPDGFAWGYSGSGPAQLALAILLEEFGESVAVAYYQDFKREIIGILPQQAGFTLTSEQINNWFESQPIKEGVEFTL